MTILNNLLALVENPSLFYYGLTKALIDYTDWFPRWYNSRYSCSSPDDTVLDVGCNWGKQTLIQERLGRSVMGFDIKRFNTWDEYDVSFAQADGRFIPVSSSSVSLVVSALSLDFIEDDRDAIDEMHRVLRSDGALFLSVANGENLYSATTGRMLSTDHAREYSTNEISDLVSNHGFEIECVWTEKLYSPVFRQTLHKYVPETVFLLAGMLLPGHLRGIIYVRARKLSVDASDNDQ